MEVNDIMLQEIKELWDQRAELRAKIRERSERASFKTEDDRGHLVDSAYLTALSHQQNVRKLRIVEKEIRKTAIVGGTDHTSCR